MSSHEHNGRTPSAVLHVGNLHYASEKAVVERVLANRPGVTRVEANPVAQTATVEYDPATTSVETLQRRVEEAVTTARDARSRVTSAAHSPRKGATWWFTTMRQPSGQTAMPACQWPRWCSTCANACSSKRD
jgi:copper chaperone CopZ